MQSQCVRNDFGSLESWTVTGMGQSGSEKGDWRDRYRARQSGLSYTIG